MNRKLPQPRYYLSDADIEAALAAARKTPSGRKSRTGNIVLKDEEKRLCRYHATFFVRMRRYEIDDEASIKDLGPRKPLDYGKRLDIMIRSIRKLRHDLSLWTHHDPAVDWYNEEMHQSTYWILWDTLEQAARLAKTLKQNTSIEEEPTSLKPRENALTTWVGMTAAVWRGAGLPATGQRDAAFTRFISVLMSRLPDDVKHKAGFIDKARAALRKWDSLSS